jgi:GTP-binding protein
MIDALEGMTHQDLALADLTEREGRAILIACNKWDAIKNKKERREEIKFQIDKSLPQLKGMPIVCISAANAQHIDQLMKAVMEMDAVWNKKVTTGQFNRWMNHVVDAVPPPMVKGRRFKFKYGTQTKIRPPTFQVFVNQEAKLPESYERYMVNRLREDLGFPGTPIRIEWKRGANPYKD